jgi:nicotinate-nucleotide--dimethylbenzimidazole phosphoribosyltransferase
MLHFTIESPKGEIRARLQEKVDSLAKPKGSLGMLEDLAIQAGWIQQSLNPVLNSPCHIVFAGDHGIASEGVSRSPREVTRQMTAAFAAGGAGVNFLARQHHFCLKIVDAGVDCDFPAGSSIIDKKIRKGTRNFLREAAMTADEAALAVERGAECVQECAAGGCNIISFGEMGIGNTSASALWMAFLAGIPLERCIGAGCDHTGNIIAHKYNVLKRAADNYRGSAAAEDIMAYFGGYEMVMAVGAMLKAAGLRMIILVDGFIMGCCVLMASRLYPRMLDYCVFGHQGGEAGHKLLLDYLGARPILHLGLRLGEGTGALCAYPVVDSAVRMLNEMDSFRTLEVVKYF